MAHLGACSCSGALVNSCGRSWPCYGPARKGPPPSLSSLWGPLSTETHTEDGEHRQGSGSSQPKPHTILIGSGVEELLDLCPIFSDNVIRADVPATAEGLQFRYCDFGEFSGAFIGNVRVVLGVEHHQFRAVDFQPMVPRIVKDASACSSSHQTADIRYRTLRGCTQRSPVLMSPLFQPCPEHSNPPQGSSRSPASLADEE
jgi:hypothetical protein